MYTFQQYETRSFPKNISWILRKEQNHFCIKEYNNEGLFLISSYLVIEYDFE